MSWEIVRDTGLLLFVSGSLLLALSWVPREIPNLPDAAWLRNIGDLMMLGGACLAVAAMTIGLVASSRNPSEGKLLGHDSIRSSLHMVEDCIEGLRDCPVPRSASSRQATD